MAGIRQILEEPFGPYDEHAVLVPELNSRVKLYLNSVCLTKPDNEMIGFVDNYPHEEVYFYGELSVESLSWLTEHGKDVVQEELSQRKEGLTLDFIYQKTAFHNENPYRILVYLKCRKVLQAAYLTVPEYPDSLVIYSLSSKRTRFYQVWSLNTVTFQKSRNFLERWRLYKLIMALGRAIPLASRTPDAIIDYCVTHHADLFPSPNLVDKPLLGQSDTSRNIFKQIVIRQARWYLAQTFASQSEKHHVNVKTWVAFCRERWAASLITDLTRFGSTRDHIMRKIENAEMKEYLEDGDEDEEDGMDVDMPDPSGVPDYDSDYEDESSSCASSDSEPDDMEQQLIESIPDSFWRRPMFDGNGRWSCDVCDFQVLEYELAGVATGKHLQLQNCVSDHHKQHLKNMGIQVTRVGLGQHRTRVSRVD